MRLKVTWEAAKEGKVTNEWNKVGCLLMTWIYSSPEDNFFGLLFLYAVSNEFIFQLNEFVEIELSFRIAQYPENDSTY